MKKYSEDTIVIRTVTFPDAKQNPLAFQRFQDTLGGLDLHEFTPGELQQRWSWFLDGWTKHP